MNFCYIHDMAQLTQGGALARLRARLPTLQPSDARVAQAIIDAPEATVHRSVSEVADAARTSTATVVRCAQKAGFQGFHDLKLALAHDVATLTAGRATADSTLGEVLEAGAQTLRDAAGLVDPDAFTAAAARITAARRVLFVAVGTSAAVAQDAGYRFSTVGVHAVAPVDVHAQHVLARGLTGSDVCVAVSHSGSTRETLAAVNAANWAGAVTVAVTSFARSPLTEMVTHTLLAGTRELALRLEALSSRLAHIAVLDALLLDVVRRTDSRAHEALDRYTAVLAEHHI